MTLVLYFLFFSAGIVFLATVIVAINNGSILVPVSMLAGILASIGLMLLLLHRKDIERSADNSISEDDDDDDFFDQEFGWLRKFSFMELESATRNFSSDRKLGGGGFGPVYEGNLDDGTKVAVKRLDPVLGVQGRKEFLAEVKTIGTISHVNLVRLVGYCAQNLNKLLVYEFMHNGSLDRWIFEPEKKISLDWQTRRKIIIDIAKGLAYLHDESREKIIHLDVKPQNILLDGEFNAKISDFGLARFVDRDQSQVVTAMRGTRGYLAPEWFSNEKITEKVDIYSFGVVVLEVMCGRKNLVGSYGEEDEYLLHLVKRKAENDLLLDVLDKQIHEKDREEAVKMVRTAIWCLQADCSMRPSISMVVKTLEGVTGVEPLTDYSFLSLAPTSLLTQAGAVSLLPMSLSGPR